MSVYLKVSTEIVSVLCYSSLETLYPQCNPQVLRTVIAQALNQISTLTCIMTGVVADHLATAFSQSSSLEDLRFRDNSLKLREMKVLWQSLCKLSSLKSINLGRNKLTEEIAGVIVNINKK